MDRDLIGQKSDSIGRATFVCGFRPTNAVSFTCPIFPPSPWHTCKERVELMRRKNERRDIASLRNGLIKALHRRWNSRRSMAKDWNVHGTKNRCQELPETYDRASRNYTLVISSRFTTCIKKLKGRWSRIL